jgi:hypothetical protein
MRYDCMDAEGRAPKVGALGDAGAVAEVMECPAADPLDLHLSQLMPECCGRYPFPTILDVPDTGPGDEQWCG